MPTRDRSGSRHEHLLLLWAARKSGVLDALMQTAGTPEAVAEQAAVTERSAALLVDALVEMGFLQRVGEEYEITNRALGFLAKRDLRSIGRRPHALDLLDLWTQVPETMVAEPPTLPDEWTRNRLGAEAATDDAVVRACVTAAVREAPDADRVLAVAGGPGVYAREFAARGRDVTLADDPEVVDTVEPLLEHTDVDLVASELPDLPGSGASGWDLLFGADVLRRRPPATNRAVLESAFEVLAPHGTLVLVDTIRGRAESTVTATVEALATGEGGVYDDVTVRDWLLDAGFVDVAVRDVPGTDRQAVVGHKHTVQ